MNNYRVIMPTIPAILNAVYDATGVRIHELPLTSERLHSALKGRKKQRRGSWYF